MTRWQHSPTTGLTGWADLQSSLPCSSKWRLQLGDKQRRQQRVRAESQPAIPWLGPTMRPPGGPPVAPEPQGRGFTRHAHLTHEEQRATQARRRLADWQREMAQTPPVAEAPSGEESDLESEAGGHTNDRVPPSTGWRPHPSVFDSRNNPPYGLPAWPNGPYDHSPCGYTQEAARQARAFTAFTVSTGNQTTLQMI